MIARTGSRMRNRALLLLLAVLTLAAAPREVAFPPAAPTPTFIEPAISPDRSEIAFVSGGDIWTVPAAGGQARLLVSHAANETRPSYSPDGSRLAFVSTRTGNGDIYVLTIATGELRRLTFDDVLDQLDAWSRDGRWLYFSSTSRDIAGMNDVYRVSAEGGTPMLVSADRYASEYWAAPSPSDPGILAFTARGLTSAQWWRKGHSHIDESEVWLVRDGTPPTYQPVTSGAAKDAWPMWSADGRAVYFVRDRQGVQNVWMASVAGCPSGRACDARQVTHFRDGRVLWPTISYDGRTIVFERNFRIWSLDVATGRAAEVPITLRGASAAAAPERLSLTAQFQGLALSPDGQKVAFLARGEVFAASAKDGGDAARVTMTPGNEGQIVWAPDSRRLVYASDRGGAWNLYLFDFGTRTETQLTRGPESDAAPKFSPDGRLLAFLRGGRELRVVDVASRQERVLARGYLDRPPFVSTNAFAWSPDGRWIAYQNTEPRQFQNVYIVSTSGGGDARPATFLANVFGGSVVWSPDGQFLLFDTSQRTEPGQLARVDLQPRTPRFREDQFRELFRDPTPRPNVPTEPAPTRPNVAPARDTASAAGSISIPGDTTARLPRSKRVEVVFDGIRQRLAFLPVGLDVGDVALGPDGKTVLFTAAAAGQQNLYTYSLDELARETPVARQLTSTAGFKTAAQFSPDGKEVFYLENGRIHVIPVESRQARQLNVTAELDVDFAREKEVVFSQAWSVLNENFYDAEFHGVDWKAVRAAYEPFAAGARTTDELRRVMALMVGELNASHLGVGGPSFSPQVVTGRLGLRFDRGDYERGGRLRVSEVIPLGPAALARGIDAGDYLLAVDGVPITARSNLDELLAHKIGRRVELTVGPGGGGNPVSRVVVVRPVAATTEKGLLYRNWVESRRAYVAKVSGGRLGYVHMPDMGAQSLTQLFADLDTENYSRQGVVIDIRNNNGGFVHAYALDVFARRGFLNMTYRGFTPSPARSVLGQRALDLPTVLVTNQHSLSDAEDFTEGYRALGLGQVVGEPTAGWIIYTSGVTLIDGSTLRVPFIRVTDRAGRNMELNPRPVDVAVKRPIGESYGGRDSQLDAAVRTLLGRVTAAR